MLIGLVRYIHCAFLAISYLGCLSRNVHLDELNDLYIIVAFDLRYGLSLDALERA